MTGQTSMTRSFVTRDELAAQIERQIVTGELPTGAKIPSERQLSEQFGVSRPVVREALRSLVERHLVDVQPGRGSFVRDPRSNEAAARLDSFYRLRMVTPRNLVEARTMLECTATALAAQRATQDDLDAMERALVHFAHANGIIEQARYDIAFHLAVVRAAANPVIETMFSSITGLTVELMLRSLSDPSVTKVSLPYHQQILDGIRRRDAEGAQRAMAEHLAVATTLYGDDYDQNLETVARRELHRLLSPSTTLEELLAATVQANGEAR
jgi:DNA-binding FadR family transcriptional regulator